MFGHQHLHKLMLIIHVKSAVIWVFRTIKILMIILYELADFIEMIRIKVFALHVKVSFDRFGKDLHFVSVCLGDFVIMVHCWIVAFTLWLEEVLDFVPGLLWSVSKLIEFFPISLHFYPKFVLNLFLQLVNARLYCRVFILRVLSPKPMFLTSQTHGQTG